MTERLNGFVVTLDKSMREDDAEHIRNAIAALKHVLDVQPLVADPRQDRMVEGRVRMALWERLRGVFAEAVLDR
jgi:hypothetical protein